MYGNVSSVIFTEEPNFLLTGGRGPKRRAHGDHGETRRRFCGDPPSLGLCSPEQSGPSSRPQSSKDTAWKKNTVMKGRASRRREHETKSLTRLSWCTTPQNVIMLTPRLGIQMGGLDPDHALRSSARTGSSGVGSEEPSTEGWGRLTCPPCCASLHTLDIDGTPVKETSGQLKFVVVSPTSTIFKRFHC